MDKESWKRKLSPEQYRVLFEKGTEPPYCGIYLDHKEKGVYCCAACGTPLFQSACKFDSGTGWPSFFKPIDKKAVKEKEDSSIGINRTEITCAKCGGHLGHVFDDGPHPTKKRYCINSAALSFVKK